MTRKSYTSDPVDVSFELDGVSFEPAALSLLDLAELAKYKDIDAESAEGMAHLNDFFRTILGGDYERFKTHCGERRTRPSIMLRIIEDIMDGLFEVSGLPTKEDSSSSNGPPNTAPTYKVVSSSGTVISMPLTPEREAELRAAVDRAAG